ncbi:MAG: M20/M25/M40 family metallo-hydrolase [Tenuifilaceae bacterium]|jgi:carboxypeptidase PM20D1|nr:M20/M25/M40 family metallo-hydrolase [Tenuifilaceae bacterium]
MRQLASAFIFILIVSFQSLHAVPNNGNQHDSIPHSALLLSDYIQYPSVTGNEKQAGQYLATMAMLKGMHVEVFTNHTDTFNFAASLYPLSLNKPNIIFLNHIDVVPAENSEQFTYPPFSGTIANGQVWGRGAIDNKGMAVMQLLAMEQFVDLAREQDLPYNVTLLSVSGEETGGHTGAKIVAERFAHKLNPMVVFGEGGTGLPKVLVNDPDKKVFTISTTFKRSLWLKLTLSMNTSGHGSVPPKKYAVQEKVRSLYKIVRWNRKVVFSKTTRDMFRELGRLEGGMRGIVLRNLGLFRPLAVRAMRQDEVIYSLITNTITITGIQTPPGPPNVIPQEIEVILDCRLLPDVDTHEFISEIRKVLDNSDVKIEILEENAVAPPSEIGECYKRMANALQVIYPKSGVIPILMPASNDNNYFRALGIPTYGIMPVFMSMEQIESIHNVDERIPIEALELGTQVYIELLKQYFE